MRFFTTTPIFLLLAIALSSAQGQNAPASTAASTPAAAKPADKKDEPTKVDAKTTAAPTAASSAAAKPAATSTTDAKNSADASNKASAVPAVATTKLDAKKPASGAAPAAASSTTADDGSSAKTAKAEGPPCVVAEFREIGIDEQDVTKRRTRALSWLQQRAKQCSVEQLLMIRNNRSQWMGTADSARLASVVDALLEAIAAQNPRVAALLYGTPPPPSPDEKK